MRAAVAGLVLLALGSAAEAEPLGPMARTRQVLEKSHDIVLGPGDRTQKVNALRDLLRGFLDTEAMGRQAMGRHLDGRSAAAVNDFLAIFQELFVRTYVQRLLLFDAPEFAFGKETVTGDTARVGTEIVTPKDRFAVDYRMRRSGDAWRATDILVEDVSLADNFRSQFDAALAKDSFDNLMDRLRRKLTGQPDKAAF
ncbi:MAG: ABC transporter substrate-binding protein [Candidatus Binatia bacterium]